MGGPGSAGVRRADLGRCPRHRVPSTGPRQCFYFDGIVGYGAQLFRTGMYLDDWADFIDEAGGHRVDRGPRAPAAPEAVRAENITFQYPSADRPALEDVSLDVRRGEVVALVGENGSGKTTLSKILSGLYLPDQGVVSWDGTDTRHMDAHATWKRVAVVPQSYANWPLSARENITLGQATEEETPPYSPQRTPPVPTKSSTGCAAG